MTYVPENGGQGVMIMMTMIMVMIAMNMMIMIMTMMMIMITYIPKNGGQGGEEAVVDKRDYRRKMAFPGVFRSNYLFVRGFNFRILAIQ